MKFLKTILIITGIMFPVSMYAQHQYPSATSLLKDKSMQDSIMTSISNDPQMRDNMMKHNDGKQEYAPDDDEYDGQEQNERRKYVKER